MGQSIGLREYDTYKKTSTMTQTKYGGHGGHGGHAAGEGQRESVADAGFRGGMRSRLIIAIGVARFHAIGPGADASRDRRSRRRGRACIAMRRLFRRIGGWGMGTCSRGSRLCAKYSYFDAHAEVEKTVVRKIRPSKGPPGDEAAAGWGRIRFRAWIAMMRGRCNFV